jgi:hypothetical protein
VLLGVSFFAFRDVNKNDGRGRWVALLKRDTFARSHRRLLDAALDRIDRSRSPECPDGRTDRGTNAKTEPGPAMPAGSAIRTSRRPIRHGVGARRLGMTAFTSDRSVFAA